MPRFFKRSVPENPEKSIERASFIALEIVPLCLLRRYKIGFRRLI